LEKVEGAKIITEEDKQKIEQMKKEE